MSTGRYGLLSLATAGLLSNVGMYVTASLSQIKTKVSYDEIALVALQV